MYLKYLQIPYKYLGREFTGCDCFGLIVLFYKNEFNINLPDQTYEETWYMKDAKVILRSYKAEGFKKVKDIKYGDVLVINEAGYPKHLGITLENGYFIHTLKTGTACHSYQQGFWSDKVHSIYRHKELKCS